MMTPDEVLSLAYKQDSSWAGYAQQLQNSGAKSKAKKLKKFLDKDWSRWLANILDYVNLGHASAALSGGQWAVSLDDLLTSFNQTVYPAARGAGFPESTFVFPDITLDRVGAPFGSLTAKLHSLLSTKEAKELAPFFGPAGIVAVDVADDLLGAYKGNDPAAVKSLADIHRDAKQGSPLAKDAVKTLAVVDHAQTKKAEAHMSFYERGVSVGHLPWDIVGDGRPPIKGHRFRHRDLMRRGGYASQSVPGRGRPVIKGLSIGDDRDHRKSSGQSYGPRVSNMTPAQRAAAARAAKQSRKNRQTITLPDGSTLRYGSNYHMPAYGLTGQENPWKTFVPFQSLNRGVFGRAAQTASQYGGGAGQGPLPDQGYGLDEFGNPVPPDYYGPNGQGDMGDMGGFDPFGEGMYEDYSEPYGDLTVDPYTGEVYDPYAELYNAPTGYQTYDPDTDTFYSDTARQEYDPETDSFYPT